MIDIQDLIDLINNNFDDKETIGFLVKAINKKTFKGWEAYFDNYYNNREWRLSKNVKNRGWSKDDRVKSEDMFFPIEESLEHLSRITVDFSKKMKCTNPPVMVSPSGRSGGHWCLTGDFESLLKVFFDVKPVIDLATYDYDYDSNKSIWDSDFKSIDEIIQVEPNDNFVFLEDAWEDEIKGLEAFTYEDLNDDSDIDDDENYIHDDWE
jgi:hypothetical protein